MQPMLTHDFFRKAYLERLKAGEALPDWQGNLAVEMLIRELNRSKKQNADFSIYQFSDVDWKDFFADIFGDEELLERSETGFESRVLNMTNCKDYLRTFITKIHSSNTQLALLDYFTSDSFCEVLSSGYIIYHNCRNAIQEVCASIIGEINRSLHGEVAPDLANIVDELAEDVDKEPSASEQEDIKKIIASLPIKKMLINGKVMEFYQLPKDEEITPIGKLIASVNKGEVQARKADWKHLVQEGFRAEQTSPMTFMYWMQESLTDIKIRDYRVDALNIIIENLPTYLQEVNASDEVQSRYIQDCKNLLHYFRQINYIIPYFDEAGRYWNEHHDDDQLNVETYLYFRFIDCLDDFKEYIAFSQAHYVAIGNKNHKFIPYIVAAQSHAYWDKLVVENIIDFCRSLYMAETTRQHYLEGWSDDYRAQTISSFPINLRNGCFDGYIRLRIKDIKDEMDADNDRLYPPTESDYLRELLEQESCAYNREMGMENFVGSEAYAREWYPAKPHVNKMAEYFIQYLADHIQQKQQQPSSFGSTTINVHPGATFNDIHDNTNPTIH